MSDDDEHLYQDCVDDYCMRFGCRAYKAGDANGYARGYLEGEAAGFAAGLAQGQSMTAGAS